MNRQSDAIDDGGEAIHQRDRLAAHDTSRHVGTGHLHHAPQLACRRRRRVPQDVRPGLLPLAGPAAVRVLFKRLAPEARLPERAHPGDAGLDLASTVDVEVLAGGRAMVPTGLAVAIPEGYAGLVLPRSGLAR